MDDLDIDGSLPGQDLEEEEVTEEIRRETDSNAPANSSFSSGSSNWDTKADEDSQRGMLYLIAGQVTVYVVYLVLVIQQE